MPVKAERYVDNNGYMIVLNPNYKPDRDKGKKWKRWIYEHRLVVQTHLGRKLENHEHIHHKDGDKLNNSIDNLEVLTSSEHALKHIDEIYGQKEDRECANPNCNLTFSIRPNKANQRIYCSELCAHTSARRCERPTKEVLEKEVWETSTVQLAKKYGVSDVAISKWCKKYGITKPPVGYWAKQYGSQGTIDDADTYRRDQGRIFG